MIELSSCFKIHDFGTQQYHFWKDAPLYHKDICSAEFIAAVFVIARSWKQPKCPSTEEWIKKKMVQLYNGALYSGKNIDILKFVGK